MTSKMPVPLLRGPLSPRFMRFGSIQDFSKAHFSGIFCTFSPLQQLPRSRIIRLQKDHSNNFEGFCFSDQSEDMSPAKRVQVQRENQERRLMAEATKATKMTQTQVVRHIAESTGVSNKVAKQFLTTLAELAIKETKKNGVFIIPGIGRLVRQERKARVGRNPATGEAIKIPAKKVVKFRVAKAVRDSIVPPKKK